MSPMTEPEKAAARALVLPYYESISNGDLSVIERVFAPDWIDRTLPPGRVQGPNGLRAALLFVRSIVPNLTAKVEDVLFDGDKVALRVTFSGTNTGGFPGTAPNGAQVSFIGFDMHRIVNDLVVETWHLHDNFGLMIQAGLIPPPSAADPKS